MLQEQDFLSRDPGELLVRVALKAGAQQTRQRVEVKGVGSGQPEFRLQLHHCSVGGLEQLTQVFCADGHSSGHLLRVMSHMKG